MDVANATARNSLTFANACLQYLHKVTVF